MFYDPTPPMSSSWSEWPGRSNRPNHYEDMEWTRPLGGYSRSYSSPRIRRFEFGDDSPRMSRTSSRSDVEMVSETDEITETEGRPPRVHHIPIMVESRGHYQTDSSPESPESATINEEEEEEELVNQFEEPVQSNTVPRVRRRNVENEEDLKRSQSQGSANEIGSRRFQRPQQPERRRRRNVTTVKVNCDADEPKEKPKDPLSEINSIIREMEEFRVQVENLNEVQDKLYRYLDEMLTRCMLKLDNIDTMGSDEIRLARKTAIGKVQSCIDLLELKAHPPAPPTPPPAPLSPKVVQETSDEKLECEEKPVIVLPFYEKQDAEKMTSSDDDNTQNTPEEPNKTVIVLPYYEKREQEQKSPEKTVIMLPYHETPENAQETSEKQRKSPEKTVIMLPFRETEKKGEQQINNVIALPYPETGTGCNDDCSESFCTKL